MKSRSKVKPGGRGTKKLLRKYGASLLCVRYRYDSILKKRFKTVELIVDEADWQPPSVPGYEDKMVSVRLDIGEVLLRERVKGAGGTWDPKRKLWHLPVREVRKLGLARRVVRDESLYN